MKVSGSAEQGLNLLSHNAKGIRLCFTNKIFSFPLRYFILWVYLDDRLLCMIIFKK